MTIMFKLTSFLLLLAGRQLKKAFEPMTGWVFYPFLLFTAAFMFAS